jgi:hypothetical protein
VQNRLSKFTLIGNKGNEDDLANNEAVWQPIDKFSIPFSLLPKNHIKNILTFLHFLHHINNFLLLFK